MARAASLANASAVNRKKNGGGSTGGNKSQLGYTFPEWAGPPAGTFDPGLEAQVRASERGLLDLIEQTHREGKRTSQDTRQAQNILRRKVMQGRADLARQGGYATQDAATQHQQLTTSFQRDLQDLAIAKQRGGQDYERALTEMQHRYATAAAQQVQAAVSQGTHETGTSAASDAVRAANEAWDKGNTDQAHNRAEEAIALREARDREDLATKGGLIDRGLGRQLTQYGIQGNRLSQEAHSQANALHLAALRAQQDRVTKLSHAKREQGIYATDVAEQAYYQAHQNNPNIVFPVPAATTAGHPGAVPSAPAIGGAAIAPVHYPHTANPVPHSTIGAGVSRPRRPYTRY